jgi:LuxR family maltose regulon positive regulatory protein
MNGAFDEAGQWLDTAWAHSHDGFLVTYRPAILATRAWVAMLRGRPDVARDHLRHMFSIGHDLQALAYLRNCPLIKDAILPEALEAGIEIPLARQLIRKFRIPAPPRDIEGWPWPVRVRTLGTFRIEIDDEPLTFGRKTPKKPIALLAALIAFGGRHVPEQKLVDALWTDDDGDSAGEAFAVSLYRLRRLLVHPEVVQFADGLVSLDPAQVWVDTWAFDRAVADAGRSGAPAHHAPDRVRQLYRGPFLPAETASAWSLPMRDRVRGQFLRHVERTGRRHEEAGRLDDAVQLYEQGIEADALAEELYAGLMRTLHRLGRRAEAMAVFRRLRQTLSVTLGIAPSTASEQLFEAIRQDG